MADGGLTQDEFTQLISREISNALAYIDTEIADRRERHLEYYRGELSDLPAPQGSSSVTDRSVADSINMMLPSLMRVFTSGGQVGKFEAKDPAFDNICREVGEYCDYVLKRDNRGEIILYQWAFDALLQIVGVVKCYWEEDITFDDEAYDSLDDDGIAMLMAAVEADPQLEVIEHSEAETEIDGVVVSVEHAAKVRRTIDKSRLRVENVPPEEFVISSDARSLEDARLKSHRTIKQVGELLDMGYDRDSVEALPTFVEQELSRERFARRSVDKSAHHGLDPMLREVAIHQGIMRCDYDGNGIKDWYFTAGGNGDASVLLEIEEYDYQVVFADFCPNPLPHVFFGRCPADDLVELQKVSTALTRQMLNNMYLSNTPQREVAIGQIENPDQLVSMAPGSAIFVKQPGAIREISVPFVAQHALTALQHFAGVAESRTGVSRASMGLDAEVLQNQSATAANIASTASHARIEMVARLWAQTGMRKLFIGMFEILKRYQNFERLIRVGKQAQSVNPAEWQKLGDADFVVQTGLGTGTRERDISMLMGIAAAQKEYILTAGAETPVCGIGHWVNTQRKIIEAAGLPDPDEYWGDIPRDWVAPKPEEEGPPPPDPAVIQAQERMQIEREKMQASMQMEREKHQQQLALQREKIEMEHAAKMRQIEIERQIAADKLAVDHELRIQELEAEAALEGVKMEAGARDGQGNIDVSD